VRFHRPKADGVDAPRRHRDPDEVSATAATLTVSLPSAAGDSNWAEGRVSASWRMRGDVLLSADLSGRTGETEAPAIDLTAAFIVPF